VDVRLSAFPDPKTVFHSRVAVKGLHLDAQTHTGEVWAELENDDGLLLPGMFGHAQVRIPSGGPFSRLRYAAGAFGAASRGALPLLTSLHRPPGEPSLVVPASALVTSGIERYVLLETGPGQYARENVVVGLQTNGQVQILQGRLFPGDRVVTAGSQELATF